MSSLSVCIITRNRHEDFKSTIISLLKQTISFSEILVLENGSDKLTIERNQFFLSSYDCVNYTVLAENLGVAGGRNELLKRAKGKYIIELDDDVELPDPDCLKRAVEYMDENPKTGIGAFDIVNFYSGQRVAKEYPFKRKRTYSSAPRRCFWFIGAGHIFRSSALQKVGLYGDFFPYGSEEQDLSVKVLDAGLDIFFLPQCVVLHKASPKARMKRDSNLGGLLLKHRLQFVILNMPWIFVFSAAVVRVPLYVVRFGSLRVIPLAIVPLLKNRRKLLDERKVISNSTIYKMLNIDSQLFF